jgi:hypothetical protein
MTNDEAIVLRKTVIGDKGHPDDFTVVWRDLTIGRIMKRSGVRIRLRSALARISTMVVIATYETPILKASGTPTARPMVFLRRSMLNAETPRLLCYRCG